MKVLIVEDNIPNQILFRKILKKESYEVRCCSNGREALAILEENDFDAVLTDWMMPDLDGLELIKIIKKRAKTSPALLMITALASEDARKKAIAAGADDFIVKPVNRTELLEKLANSIEKGSRPSVGARTGSSPREKQYRPGFAAAGLAASTGGPLTLQKMLPGLEITGRAAFFLVLHGPEWMLQTFSQRMNEQCSLEVMLAEEAMAIKPDRLYVAPGNRHMTVTPELKISLNQDPPENFVRPSADPLFRSLSKVFGSKCLAAVMTGMGSDGTIGSGYISAAGGKIIAQDPKSAILSSMPQSVIDMRIADLVVPIDKMAKTIMETLAELV